MNFEELSEQFFKPGKLPDPYGDYARLEQACSGDLVQLKRYLKLRLAGEPVSYILRVHEFHGLRFRVDRRVYLTDPELEFLVETLIAWCRRFQTQHHRGPRLLELGVGAGCLAIALRKAVPFVTIWGVDIDPGALELAQHNALLHHCEIHLQLSDLFDSVPDLIQPDLIYADPPWGNPEMLYDADRPSDHYLAMPRIAAIPLGDGIASVHYQILENLRRKPWTCQVLFNMGTLPEDVLSDLAKSFPCHRVLHGPHQTRLLHLSPEALPSAK